MASRPEDYSGWVTTTRRLVDNTAASLLHRDGRASARGQRLARTPAQEVFGPQFSPKRLHQNYLQRARLELDLQNPKAALQYAEKAEALVSWTEDGESRHLEGLAYYAMGDWRGAEVCLGEACISNVAPRAKLHYNLVVRRHSAEDASPYTDVPNLPPCPPACPICHPQRIDARK